MVAQLEDDPDAVLTIPMGGQGQDDEDQGYYLPAYNPVQFSNADLSGMPSFTASQDMQAPAAQGMTTGITGVDPLPRYTKENVERGDLPPMNQAFDVDAQGKNAAGNLIRDKQLPYGGGFMTIGGQTTAILNPADKPQEQTQPLGVGHGQLQLQGQGAGGAGAPQFPASATAAVDAPYIERAKQQARLQNQTIAMNLARRTSEKEMLDQTEEKLKGQQKTLPSGLERWDLEHFVADQTGPGTTSRFGVAKYNEKLEAAKATLAHLDQVENGLDDIGRRKSQIDEELKVLTSGPMPPSPDEAGGMVAASLNQRRAAAQAKADAVQQKRDAAKAQSDRKAELGRLNAAAGPLSAANKTIQGLTDPSGKERQAIKDQVRAAGIKPDGTLEGDKRYQDALNAALAPALAKAKAEKARLEARRQELTAATAKGAGGASSTSSPSSTPAATAASAAPQQGMDRSTVKQQLMARGMSDAQAEARIQAFEAQHKGQ